MRWKFSERHACGCLYLDCGRDKIILDRDKCYTVNYTLNVQAEKEHYKNAVFALQLRDCGKKCDVFVSHTPIAYSDVTFTVSVAGVFISTKGCSQPELLLRLISPGLVRLKQASIYLAEI